MLLKFLNKVKCASHCESREALASDIQSRIDGAVSMSVITVASEKYSCWVSCKWQVLELKKEDMSLTGNSRKKLQPLKVPLN